ncbi:MAG: glycogen debranching protein GlgX [Verrucomicrobiota bacterium]
MSALPARFDSTPGAHLTPDGVHFTVFSRHATAMDLCLYDPAAPARETGRIRMTRGERDLWYAFVPKLKAGQPYGYRAHGPWMPQNALRYNSNKLLLDPYALAIVGKPDARASMHTPTGPGFFPGAHDNGPEALKSAVIDRDYDWGDDKAPNTPWRDSVIYEMHVKGFTQTHPDVPKKLRGTYAGLAHPSALKYLKDLGVTALQLLPVHQHLDDQFLIEKGLTNYWGYNTIGFFAPHNEFASVSDPQAQVREFKDMVKACHAAGLEVILDVVYNHSAEGDERGPMLMFRGFDDRLYYRHDFDEHGSNYINITGCGNAVDSASGPGLKLVLDSLRYWVTEMRVDGFRFDLAVTVARDEKDEFNVNGQFLTAVAQDPILSQVKLIAEPWDIMRFDSYQVGAFPEPWRELNGKYRDTVRRFWAGDEGSTAEFAKRFCGSQDVYGGSQRPALSSVNFLTSHDGFTLMDLVSYASKHNEANGEENRDGDNANHSISCGVEGPTSDIRVNRLRGRLRRSMIATLLTSVGVPFITAGDERGRTQKGNNNAYCQDNEISWIDWGNADAEMLEFTRQMLAFRRQHPEFRRTEFFDGQWTPATGLPDVAWLEGNGSLLCHDEWHDPTRTTFGALMAGKPPMVLLFNRGDLPTPFVLPGTAGCTWSTIFDTATSQSFDTQKVPPMAGGTSITVNSHSLVCLKLSAGILGLTMAC